MAPRIFEVKATAEHPRSIPKDLATFRSLMYADVVKTNGGETLETKETVFSTFAYKTLEDEDLWLPLTTNSQFKHMKRKFAQGLVCDFTMKCQIDKKKFDELSKDDGGDGDGGAGSSSTMNED